MRRVLSRAFARPLPRLAAVISLGLSDGGLMSLPHPTLAGGAITQQTPSTHTRGRRPLGARENRS